jgi:dolichyl-phosphate beta-glucosyltransferase
MTRVLARQMPTIAIVMPAYNEANRIEQTLTSIARYRAGGAPIGPVIVADDGSDDATVEVARRVAAREGLPVEILSFEHRGKASTVRSAMLDVAPRVAADYLMMLDADDELPIEQLDRVEWSDDRNAIYIGRRVGAVGDAVAARPSIVRRSMSVAMRIASRTLLGIRFPDTQCGFKLFPRFIVPGLFGQQRSTGWTFDAELLYIADRVSGVAIIEIPVVWTPRGTSRVRPAAAVISGLAMFGTAFRRVRRVYRPVATRVTGPDAEPAVSR